MIMITRIHNIIIYPTLSGFFFRGRANLCRLITSYDITRFIINAHWDIYTYKYYVLAFRTLYVCVYAYYILSLDIAAVYALYA